jgi:hypothetical protein
MRPLIPIVITVLTAMTAKNPSDAAQGQPINQTSF